MRALAASSRKGNTRKRRSLEIVASEATEAKGLSCERISIRSAFATQELVTPKSEHLPGGVVPYVVEVPALAVSKNVPMRPVQRS